MACRWRSPRNLISTRAPRLDDLDVVGVVLELDAHGAALEVAEVRHRAPHDRSFAGLGEHRADGLDPVEALGDEDALHLAAVGQVLLEPHLRAAEPARESLVPQLVVTSRCGASLVPQLAPSDGRDIAMRRDDSA